MVDGLEDLSNPGLAPTRFRAWNEERKLNATAALRRIERPEDVVKPAPLGWRRLGGEGLLLTPVDPLSATLLRTWQYNPVGVMGSDL
jgi:hypothetical protein